MLGVALGAVAAPTAALAQSGAGGAAADPSRWELRVGADIHFRTAPEYDAFTRDVALPGPTVSFGRDLFVIGNRVAIAIEAGWRFESARGAFASQFSTTLATHSFWGGVIARYAQWGFFEPYVRLAGGGSIAQVGVHVPWGVGMSGDAGAGFGEAGAGFVLRTYGPPGEAAWVRSLRFGIAVEGGYTLGSTMSLSVRSAMPSDPRVARDAIDVRPTSLGSLDTSGGYVRFTALMRF